MRLKSGGSQHWRDYVWKDPCMSYRSFRSTHFGCQFPYSFWFYPYRWCRFPLLTRSSPKLCAFGLHSQIAASLFQLQDLIKHSQKKKRNVLPNKTKQSKTKQRSIQNNSGSPLQVLKIPIQMPQWVPSPVDLTDIYGHHIPRPDVSTPARRHLRHVLPAPSRECDLGMVHYGSFIFSKSKCLSFYGINGYMLVPRCSGCQRCLHPDAACNGGSPSAS